jgi:hypothetical protein
MKAPQVRKGLVTEQAAAVSAATPATNAIMAMTNVVARVIFTFHYHFVIAA